MDELEMKLKNLRKAMKRNLGYNVSHYTELLIGDPVSAHGWIFISDQQNGLDKIFDIVVPEAQHRWCIRHMYENFKEKFKGKVFKDLLWSAARASHRAKPEDYVAKCYHKDTYLKTYEPIIHLVKSFNMWHKSTQIPLLLQLLENNRRDQRGAEKKILKSRRELIQMVPSSRAVDVQFGSTVVAFSAINVAVNVQSKQVVALANAQRRKLPIKKSSNVNPPRTSYSKK
ncbi:hypothetical protein L3X38_028223 [Prunus dulcis]|uniref:MULE transposase domain-containing protein n=1 Tax=Prunus dulcis TaxID=3755 RepID=A0AAD4VQ96_PRUDU|nr:hypothetical protein L3X38_028223 [Prunus dulcis]